MAVNKPDSNKKWHQQWWGIIVLIGIVIIFISGAAFVFFLVKEIQAQTQVYLAQYQQVQAGDIDLAPTASFPRELIETSDDPSLGPVNAPVVIVEFADFQCPYCKQAQPVLKRIVEAYPLQVKIIYRDLPNTLGHPQAFNAALAGECADEQGQFWAYHDLIYTNQDNLTEDLFKTLAWQSGLNQEQFDQCFDQKKYDLSEQYTEEKRRRKKMVKK